MPMFAILPKDKLSKVQDHNLLLYDHIHIDSYEIDHTDGFDFCTHSTHKEYSSVVYAMCQVQVSYLRSTGDYLKNPFHGTLFTEPFLRNPFHGTLFAESFSRNPFCGTLFAEPFLRNPFHGTLFT